MNAIEKAYYVLRYLGPRFAWPRARIAIARRLGIERRKWRTARWEQIGLERITLPGTPITAEEYAAFKRRQSPPFLFPLGQPPAIPAALRDGRGQRRPGLAERLRLLAKNRCVYFFHTPSSQPVEWYTNTLTGGRGVADRLWCDILQFVVEQGDIRTMWEPSRGVWAVDVARAHAHQLDADGGALFWRWLDSWMNACPPFVGVQWHCGQEAAVRLIAVVLAAWSLADDAATTPDRWTQLARLAWVTGDRIYRHIHYAVSLKNNHAISEACGLLLVSQLFPEFGASAKWAAKGRRVLAREIHRQTYADGSYLQHSMNYQRVMLHGAMLGLRLAELAGRPFERELYDRLGGGGEFLFQMMDPATGRLPNYGHDDGSCVLPLTECDFTDYRPVIQATHYLAHRRRRLPPGPWDEELLWLFGRETLDAAQGSSHQATSSAFEVGGYYTLRANESWAMIRCHTYRDRPGQADALHLDLWWRGQNVICDCGTYQYYIPDNPDLERYFKATAAHNTVELDHCEPFEQVSHYLWFPWPRARKRHFNATSRGLLYFEGEHYGYDRAPWHVLHRRTVIVLADDVWIVIDDLLGTGEHYAVLRWHLLDAPYTADPDAPRLDLETPAGNLFIHLATHPAAPQAFDVARGRDEPGHVQGFTAPYYGQRLPIPTLEVVLRAALPQRLITTIAPLQPAAIRLTKELADYQAWELATGAGSYALKLACPTRRTRRTLLECSPGPPPVSQECAP